MNQYTEAYFLRGKESGLSLYTDYRWMPDLTIPMVCSIISHLGVITDNRILDFGCARGYVVRALREIGYEAYGVDVSEWAIRNADEAAKPYVNWLENGPPILLNEFDWVIAKDVLEHIPKVDDTIAELLDAARVGVFAVVPLSMLDGTRYVVSEYEDDVTHIHRLTLATWAGKFMRPGWTVEASYRVRGVKDNYAYSPVGNGFITARRQR